jgi:spermidine/putrescine-binding protein
MQVSLNSDPKNLFLIGNMVMNHEVNSQDKTQVNKAFDYLKPLIHPGNVSIQGDDMIASIVNGNFDVAVLYSGDAVAATQSYVANNSGMFTLARPDAGTNIYFDSMVISTQSTHQLAAFQFMNFMRQNSAANSEYVGLASPYQAVLDELKTTTFKDFAS